MTREICRLVNEVAGLDRFAGVVEDDVGHRGTAVIVGPTSSDADGTRELLLRLVAELIGTTPPDGIICTDVPTLERWCLRSANPSWTGAGGMWAHRHLGNEDPGAGLHHPGRRPWTSASLLLSGAMLQACLSPADRVIARRVYPGDIVWRPPGYIACARVDPRLPAPVPGAPRQLGPLHPPVTIFATASAACGLIEAQSERLGRSVRPASSAGRGPRALGPVTQALGFSPGDRHTGGER